MRFQGKKIIICFLMLCIVMAWRGFYIAGDMSPAVIIQQETAASVLFLDKPLKLNKPLWFVSGRLFLPLKELVSSIGGCITETQGSYMLSWSAFHYELLKQHDKGMVHPFYFDHDDAYISLLDISQLFHLAVVFDCENKKLAFYNRQMPTPPTVTKTPSLGKAYLRLEDIAARADDNGEALEKLRVIIDYLYSKGQRFYIAWIPLYTDPSKNFQNDLTANFNFYNADFIYTLDYAVNHFGHIVLHGLTHQELDTVSGIGTEFGKNTPFTKREIDERMKRAKEIAANLGFDNSIFEFPHTTSTMEQLKIAEKNFDVIYQQNYYGKCIGKIFRVIRWNRSIFYVPTPSGYVESLDKLPNTLEKIDQMPSDQILSLFVHPYVDFNQISCETTVNAQRVFHYDENGIFAQLVRKVTDKNLVFSSIDTY